MSAAVATRKTARGKRRTCFGPGTGSGLCSGWGGTGRLLRRAHAAAAVWASPRRNGSQRDGASYSSLGPPMGGNCTPVALSAETRRWCSGATRRRMRFSSWSKTNLRIFRYLKSEC